MRFDVVAAVLLVVGVLSLTCAQEIVYSADASFGMCNCDLTVGVCDVGCCCDEVCTDAQLAYSEAIGCAEAGPTLSDLEERHCVNKDTLRRSNFGGAFWLDDQLCIVTDNYASEGFFHTSPDPEVYTGSQFTQAFQDQTSTFIKDETTSPRETYAPGAMIVATSDSSPAVDTFLALPTGAVCDDSGAVGFLEDVDARTCLRTTTTAASDGCLGVGAEALVSMLVLPAPLSSSTVPITLASVVCYASPAASAAVVACPGGGTSGVAPSYDGVGGTCTNALRALHYRIEYSTAMLVTGVSVDLELVASLDAASGAHTLTQTYSVTWVAAAAGADARATSGNPGYQPQLPVVAGHAADTYVVPGTLSFASGDGSGVCVAGAGASARTQIAFATDVAGGCMQTVTLAEMSDCAQLQSDVLAVLQPNATLDVVGVWGASDPAFTNDWIDIEHTQPTSVPTGGAGICNNIVNAIDFEFLYAPLGSVLNPQYKIIGARIEYRTSDWHFACEGVNCDAAAVISSATNTFPLSSTVTWVPVDGIPAEELYPRNPNLLPELPSDVWYPFRLNSASTSSTPTAMLVYALAAFVSVLLYRA